MTDILEIPRALWPDFFQALLKLGRERPVRLELASLEVGDQGIGVRLPLRSIELEQEGAAGGGLIIVLGSDEEELLHVVPAPRKVYVRYDPAKVLDCVVIEEADESKTFVFFQGLREIEAGEPVFQEGGGR